MSDNRAKLTGSARICSRHIISVWRELNNKWIKYRGKHNIKGWNMWVCICLSNPAKSRQIPRIISSLWGRRLPFWAGPVSGWHSGPRSSSPPSFAASPGGRCTRDASGDASRCSWSRESEREREERGGFYKCQCFTSPAAPLDTRGLTSLSLSAATGRQYSNVLPETNTHIYLNIHIFIYCRDIFIPAVLFIQDSVIIFCKIWPHSISEFGDLEYFR